MKITWGPNGPSDGIDAPYKVAIVGVGVISGIGNSKEKFWKGLFGPAPVGMRTVDDFDPSLWLGPKEIRRHDRFNQFGIAAASLALEDAGDLQITDPARAGVLVGTGVGGLESLETQVMVGNTRGFDRVTPFLVPLMMANAGAASISMRFGLEGPCETTVTACAAGTQAIGNAARLIASGRCDVMFTGGSECAMTETAKAGFRNMTAMSNAGISRPFDKDRDGFMMGEGAAILILEELERAKARGAHIYGTIDGAASNADAYHITAPRPHGIGAASCMQLAIDDAGLLPSDITHINAHGTSTPMNDLAEGEAMNLVFGPNTPPVTSVKGALGHSFGSAGALEAVAACLTIEHRIIPPTVGTKDIDPDIHVDVVMHEGRPFTPGPIISNSFGFGGHNGSIIISPYQG